MIAKACLVDLEKPTPSHDRGQKTDGSLFSKCHIDTWHTEMSALTGR